MFLYIITWTVIYFILILLLHNLYLFFQKNLTTTKTKDYYNFPNKEYNKINSILDSQIKLDKAKEKQSEIILEKKNLYSNLTSSSDENNNSKIIQNYDSNLINKESENNLVKTNIFDSQLKNNNMKSELEEFLNKLNN